MSPLTTITHYLIYQPIQFLYKESVFLLCMSVYVIGATGGHMMAESSRIGCSIVNCAILTIAGILAVVSLGLFVDAYSDYKNALSNSGPSSFLTTVSCFLVRSLVLGPTECAISWLQLI